MGDGVGIGDRSEIRCAAEVLIGDGTLIAWDLVIMDHSYYSLGQPPEPLRIGERVSVGCRALVLPGVNVGDGAVVAAGSIVAIRCHPAPLLQATRLG